LTANNGNQSTFVRRQAVRSSIQVIERMMSLLDALATHPGAVSLKHLAADTRLHPSTAHRILNVMVKCRMVERVEPGIYRFGMRLLELGSIVRSRLSVRQEALRHMQQLQQQLGETVNLSVRDGDEVVYIERASPANQTTRVMQIVSVRAPLHVSAAGKIFLADDGMEKCADYARRTGLPRVTEGTLTDADSLLREIERAIADGCAFENEEAEKGVCCIGAGIYNDDAELVAGLSVSAPADRFSKTWAPQLKQTAERISRAIGWQPPGAGRQ
jgi:IclR family KDG regulon transcriptional repressor